jgi:hypothetical protein
MQRNTIFLLFLFFYSCITFAQNKPEIIHFKKMSKLHYDQKVKDYPHFDVVEFPNLTNKDEKFKAMDSEWHKLWNNFLDYCHTKNLYPQKKQVVDLCLYFNGQGHLDHLAHHFKRDSEYSELFIKYFQEYMQTHEFGIKPNVKFSQCGRLEILPRKK